MEKKACPLTWFEKATYLKNQFAHDTDLVDYLELARVALTDPEISEHILSQCDIGDAEAVRLAKQLEKVLN